MTLEDISDYSMVKLLFDRSLDACFLCKYPEDEVKKKQIEILLINPIAKRLFSLEEVEIINFDFLELFEKSRADLLYSKFKEVKIKNQSCRLLDFLHQTSEGGKIFSIDIIPINSRVFITTFHDLSSKIQLERALIASVNQIETAIAIGNIIREGGKFTDTLKGALKAAKEMVGGKYAAIFRKRNHQIELVYEIEFPGDLIPEEYSKLRPIGPNVQSFSGQAAFYNKTIIKRTSEMQNEIVKKIFTELNINYLVSCPISVKDELLGVVQITRDNEFTAQEIELLETFSTWVGLIIKDQLYYDKILQLKNEGDFFIDLMTHDLTNLNTMSFACLEDIESRFENILTKDTDAIFFFTALKRSLQRTQELITKVRVLSNVRDLTPNQLIAIDVIQSLRNSIRSIKEVNNFTSKIEIIEDKKEQFFIKATPILDQLFINIFLNVFDVITYPEIPIEVKVKIDSNNKDFDLIIIQFESLQPISLDFSKRILEGSIINEIGGTRSDLSSLGHIIIKSLIEQLAGKISFDSNSKPNGFHGFSITFQRINKKY